MKVFRGNPETGFCFCPFESVLKGVIKISKVNLRGIRKGSALMQKAFYKEIEVNGRSLRIFFLMCQA